ncbi:MAG: tRNA pseudouridine(55) synthase TruB [Candidatus Gastranaerophilaceae bacterium]|jgi:tRNA pseudouridine55 synthase
MFGILNINKPKGYTSHDVVAKLRKILKIKQIGHTGTLDPMATGVLPICIGKATKIIQYLADTKSYRAYVKLGIQTDTCDIEGKIIEEHEVKDINVEKINECLKNFSGEIEQTPPMFSAVHYNGKRLYEYARKNIEITDIPKRKVFISSITLLEVQYPFEGCQPLHLGCKPNFQSDLAAQKPVLVLDIDCSFGTYIRSIAHDLGKMLHCGATLYDLMRTRAGIFEISESYSIEKIEEFAQNNNVTKILINPVEVLNLEIVNVDETQIENIKNGKYLNYKNFDLAQNQKVQLVYHSNLAAIAEFRDSKLYPKTVFI